jgi:carbon monoxide dehydrogenase subunit G
LCQSLRIEVSGTKEARVAAPRERCFEILTGYEAFPQWWPGCKSASLLDSGSPEAQDVELVFDTSSPVGDIDCTVRFRTDPLARVWPERLSGRLKRLDGDGWLLSDRGDGTTDVRYSAAAEMDTGLPGFLERAFRDKAKHFFIDAPVEALKRRAEAS